MSVWDADPAVTGLEQAVVRLRAAKPENRAGELCYQSYAVALRSAKRHVAELRTIEGALVRTARKGRHLGILGPEEVVRRWMLRGVIDEIGDLARSFWVPE